MRKLKTLLPILCLVVMMLLGTSSALFATAVSGATAAPEHSTLTWEGDPATTQTITWRTGATTVGGQVQYAEAVYSQLFPQHAITAAAGITGLNTNTGDLGIHSVMLTGLKPGTRYIYRVGGPGGWSQPSYFTTAPSTTRSFKFLVFGDSQSINYNVWGTTAHNAYQANPDAAFFTNVGDLVDVGQDYAQWNKWFTAAKGLVNAIPAMPIAGNHESYTPERVFSMPVLFTAQFKLPQNGPAGLKGQVYSFDYADVHFVMLDSQEGEQRQYVPDMLARQKAWLERDLQATKKKWKIVFIHRPLYNNKPGEGDLAIRKAFGPVFDSYHVDVVFTAHDHAYARTYPLYNGVRVNSPAQGTVYVATGRSATKTYKNIIAKEWHEFFHDPAGEPNYITVEVSESLLRIKAFKQSGALIDVWEVKRH